MKKILSLCLSIFLLFSCKKENRPYDCYQCFFSNMILVNHSLPYQDINMKQIQKDNLNLDNTYYGNYYIINSQTELDSFYSDENLLVDSNDKDNYSLLPTSSSMAFFIVQIPKGYRAYRRSNSQQELNNKDIILITTNFYYYTSHPEIVYCYIDLKKDDSLVEDSTFSFLYIYNSYYSSIIKDGNIRFVYSVNS